MEEADTSTFNSVQDGGRSDRLSVVRGKPKLLDSRKNQMPQAVVKKGFRSGSSVLSGGKTPKRVYLETVLNRS